MFAFAIWDEKKNRLFCARDRFGVKPFYYSLDNKNNFLFASEIKALHKAGITSSINENTWATYLSFGLYEHSENTFWEHINSLKPGHSIILENNKIAIKKWYSIEHVISVSKYDERSYADVREEYLAILKESIRFRFRSDTPVGINLSGGLDSSILLGLVDQYKGTENEITAFTFATGDALYDELLWAKEMLAHTRHPHEVCYLSVDEIPELAKQVQWAEDEPFGGFPTLAYSKIFKRARSLGIKVLLDGQGMDEQWAGYEYYKQYIGKTNSILEKTVSGPVQSSKRKTFRTECLEPNFLKRLVPVEMPIVFNDALRNMQYRDAFVSKIPRALRFNDRISMMYSTELREPFLDHRLFELAFQQKSELKIKDGTQKWLLRDMLPEILPRTVSNAPKRPLQTPQREWLQGPLRNWVEDCLSIIINAYGGSWFITKEVRKAWKEYLTTPVDNSFFIWQWISLALILENQKNSNE